MSILDSLFLGQDAVAASSTSGDAAAAGVIAVVFGLMGLYMLIPLTVFGVMIVLIIFWILMLVDCVKRDFKKQDDKIMWILIVVLASWIGGIIYYFMIKREDKH